MSSKPHIVKRLHGSTSSRARRPIASSKQRGDPYGMNLRSATWSKDAEGQLTGRTVPGHFRMEIVGAAEGDDEAGVGGRALEDGRVDARVEPSAGRASGPEISPSKIARRLA